jgi:hypothetical protein
MHDIDTSLQQHFVSLDCFFSTHPPLKPRELRWKLDNHRKSEEGKYESSGTEILQGLEKRSYYACR